MRTYREQRRQRARLEHYCVGSTLSTAHHSFIFMSSQICFTELVCSRAGIQTRAMVTSDLGTESVTPIAKPYAILGAIFKYPICKIGTDSCIPQVGEGGTYKGETKALVNLSLNPRTVILGFILSAWQSCNPHLQD